MTTRGIWRIHHAVQTAEAWKDWRRLAEEYTRQGHGALVQQLQPPTGAGWRTIDKRIAKLRQLSSPPDQAEQRDPA